jgi:hypothetical protein
VPCFTLLTADLTRKFSLLFTVNFINENVYPHRRANVLDFLNRFLYECLSLTFGMMLKIIFCNINVFFLLDELF